LVEELVDVTRKDDVALLGVNDVGIRTELVAEGEGTGSAVGLSVEATELTCVDVCKELDDAEATGLDCCEIWREPDVLVAASDDG
jgi:hypothetical protein